VPARAGSHAAILAWILFTFSGTPGAAEQQDPGSQALTFSREIAPIIFTHCAGCHRPGGSAPFSLLTYQEVRPRATQIAAVTRTRAMPPWKSEPGYGEFVGQKWLGTKEIATIAQWVKDGMREGEARDLPPLPVWNTDWQLGAPDLVLTPTDAYTLPAEGPDRFRVFVLPIPIDATRYVRGIEFRPHDPQVVHHANILLDRTSRSRERNQRDPTLGESGLLAATTEYPAGHLLGWTPGRPDALLPKGLAWPLAPQTDLVVQLHMVPNGTPQPVQFSVGLYFTSDPPERTPALLRLGRRDIDIPAGEGNYRVTDSYVLPVDVEIQALKPHAHYLARGVSAVAVLPDGSTKNLLYIKDWDFRWQHVYRCVTPVTLPRGSRLTMQYIYDNAGKRRFTPQEPPRRVGWGPRSSDEMGDLWIQLLTRDERDLAALNRDFQRKWTEDEIAGYESLIRKDGSSIVLREEAGLLYLQNGQWQEAARHYRAALAQQPGSSVLHFNLATALMVGGQLDDATSSFREALRLAPGYAAAHANLGNVLSRLGRRDEALAEYQAAIRADPGHAGAHNNVGYLLMQRGELAAALPYFTEAIRLNPRLPDAHFNLGLLFRAQGEPQRALTHFRDALNASPAWMTALDALAATYAEMGEFDLAIDTVNDALRLASGTSAEAGLRERAELYRMRTSKPADSDAERQRKP
jgi:tetratricopeptide (TPR) repeat protein/mono/diheme cytochrome c family protein